MINHFFLKKKQENFRKVFDNFDFKKIAKYHQSKCAFLLLNDGIIRNKLNIRSAISIAQLFMEIQKEYGPFSKFIWNYLKGKQIVNQFHKKKDVPATSILLDRISKELKKFDYKFFSSTIIYVFMQSVG